MPSNFHTTFHPVFIFLKSYKIISKSGMRLEVLMGNKISKKFVLTNEGIICALFKKFQIFKSITNLALCKFQRTANLSFFCIFLAILHDCPVK
jgi:hypothetical protein